VKNNLEKILLVPDTHSPYEDKKAWKLLLKVAESFKPKHLIIEGDFADCYGISDFNKDPNRMLKFDWEAEETVKRLKEIKEASGASNLQFIEGNHEDRLRRYLQKNAPELYNFISVPKIFKLDEMGYKFTPYKETYKLGKLNVTHDAGNAGKTAHYQALDVYQHNIVIGHTHRIGYTVQGSASNERHVGAMFGWLGDVEQVDYMHKVKAKKEWSLGFGIGYLDKTTGNVYLVPVPIVNYSVVIEGVLFKV